MDPYKTIFSKCLVLDFGSGFTKGGLSHEDNPRVVLETLVGWPLLSRVLPSNKPATVIGARGHSASLFRFEQPVRRGLIEDFDATKLIINKVLEELRVKSLTDIPIIITEATGTPLSQRKRMTELIFENYDASCLYFGNQAILSLYSLGKTTGCVLDVGHGVAQAGCIFNGYKLDHTFERSEVGGEDVDRFLATLLRKNGLHLKPRTEFGLLKSLKETKCLLIDFARRDELDTAELAPPLAEETSFALPDGKEVRLGNERLLAPELLFRPDLAGLCAKGVQHLVAGVIERTNMDLKNKLFKNIYLTGGATNTTNFANRFSQELKALVPAKADLSVTTPTGRKDFHAWHGASILSLTNDFSNLWIKKTEYKEMGDAVLLRKGF